MNVLGGLTYIRGRIAGSIRPNPPGSIDRFLEDCMKEIKIDIVGGMALERMNI